jgi:hypothetical protein
MYAIKYAPVAGRAWCISKLQIVKLLLGMVMASWSKRKRWLAGRRPGDHGKNILV